MTHPHLLLITIDSLRADHVGTYGRSPVPTPEMDAFAAQGVCFRQHLTSVSATLTSHAALMTGCTPSVNGVNWNSVTRPRRRQTLPEILAPHGYQTSAITSWGGFTDQQVYGFSTWYSQDRAADLSNRGDRTLERVLHWISQADPRTPQALWVHFIDPHAPDNAPDPYPPTYQGEVAFTDMLLGQLFRAWDAAFGADRSLVTLTADHGEHLNDHGIARGHGTLWEIALHVPLLMRAPGLIAPGAIVPELTRQIDVLPTLLDYAQIPMPHNVEGMSLRGLIVGTDANLNLVHHGQAIYDDHYSATIRNAEYALHFGDGKSLASLYDRRRDSSEEYNLLPPGAAIRHSVAHSIADAGPAVTRSPTPQPPA